MHEFVAAGQAARTRPDVRALDIAKRLMDYGFHPPTNYFPLIVPEALMIEPTETESQANARRVHRRDAADRRGGAHQSRTCCTTRRTPRPSGGWTRSRPPRTWCCAAGRRKWASRPSAEQLTAQTWNGESGAAPEGRSGVWTAPAPGGEGAVAGGPPVGCVVAISVVNEFAMQMAGPRAQDGCGGHRLRPRLLGHVWGGSQTRPYAHRNGRRGGRCPFLPRSGTHAALPRNDAPGASL